MTIALLLVGLVLIILNVRSVKKDANSFEETLNASKDNLGDFALQVGELRKEFAESILELQEEMEGLKEKISILENEHKSYEDADSEPHSLQDSTELLSETDAQKYDTESDETSLGSSAMKTQQIQNMLSEGYSVDEISEKLNIGKGEVILIKDLYIK